jgi:outer membrane protein assembly factor BamE (lipoprotein component of BamABCDE complex)
VRNKLRFSIAKHVVNRDVGLWIVLSVVCAGCPLPVNEYGIRSRTNVSEETALTIIPGRTTREEVLLALGDPDEVSPDGQSFVYRWTKVKLTIEGGFSPIEMGKKYQLLVSFSEHGVVTQREVHGSLTPFPNKPP